MTTTVPFIWQLSNSKEIILKDITFSHKNSIPTVAFAITSLLLISSTIKCSHHCPLPPLSLPSIATVKSQHRLSPLATAVVIAGP
jgi:hypothetical protein